MAYPGILIVFEGIDGAGKTTQVNRLREALERAGEIVIQSKEPTDGHWGRLIRESAKGTRMPLADELHAFVEDRREHLANTVLPALDRGAIVLLDRYFYSTIAYQGARGGDTAAIEQAMEFAAVPDVVLLIDVDPALGISRISGGRNETPNAFETHAGLMSSREIFLELATRRPEIQLIRGEASIRDVEEQINAALLDGVFKAKRCGKTTGCDGMYCSFRETGNCNWANLKASLRARAKMPSAR